MKAVWQDVVVAEAPDDELIRIEGNWYFPPERINKEFFQGNDHQTECFWKGTANYYDIHVGDHVNESGAWYYPDPKDGSVERVKKDFAHYVAFYPQVDIRS